MNLFTAKNLSYAYAEGEMVLRDLEFTLHQGESLALLGANGCGKSTLLQLMAGLRFPTQGSLYYGGVPLVAMYFTDPKARAKFRQDVGIVFQTPDSMFFHSSVNEEISYGPSQIMDSDKAQECARHWMGLMGLSHQADEPPYLLSGGEKRKLALACVLAAGPTTLLLDEPTANLDAATADLVREYLSTWSTEPGHTLIVATHDLDLVRELSNKCLLITPCHRQAAFADTSQVLSNYELLVQMNVKSRRGLAKYL